MLAPEDDVKTGRNILVDVLNKNIRHPVSYVVGRKKVKCSVTDTLILSHVRCKPE
jgi:hypothetical protein